jgi:hypothetical protein
MATISKVSPRFPKVIMPESNIDRGKAKGTQCTTTKPISFINTQKLSPLPTISSKYNQKNCNVNTKTAIVNVAKKGPIKALITNMSSFLNNCFLD